MLVANLHGQFGWTLRPNQPGKVKVLFPGMAGIVFAVSF